MKNQGFWLAAGIGILLDVATKEWAIRGLKTGSEIVLWPGVFHLTYAENRGAAWSLFRESGGFLKWISLLVSLGLISLALWGRPLGRWQQIGYGLILAGAVLAMD